MNFPLFAIKAQCLSSNSLIMLSQSGRIFCQPHKKANNTQNLFAVEKLWPRLREKKSWKTWKNTNQFLIFIFNIFPSISILPNFLSLPRSWIRDGFLFSVGWETSSECFMRQFFSSLIFSLSVSLTHSLSLFPPPLHHALCLFSYIYVFSILAFSGAKANKFIEIYALQ